MEKIKVDTTFNAIEFILGEAVLKCKFYAVSYSQITYDNNRNLTKDLNKGITNISYNSLNFDKIGFASEMFK